MFEFGIITFIIGLSIGVGLIEHFRKESEYNDT